MAHFLFLDESGQDHGASPYEVLAGVSIEDSKLGALIREMHKLEHEFFGGKFVSHEGEMKARKFLSTKVFKKASKLGPLDAATRARMAQGCMRTPNAGPDLIAALAQAKIAYVMAILDLCNRFSCKVFASVLVDPTAYTPSFVRKDYAYLFERFTYFLEDAGDGQQGIVVFDELERSQSRKLVEQMDLYFRATKKGVDRSRHVVPEPFFVHSDLTTGIQLADIVAYVLSWSYRTRALTRAARVELSGFARLIARDLLYTAVRTIDAGRFDIPSIKVIDSLRMERRAPFNVF